MEAQPFELSFLSPGARFVPGAEPCPARRGQAKPRALLVQQPPSPGASPGCETSTALPPFSIGTTGVTVPWEHPPAPHSPSARRGAAQVLREGAGDKNGGEAGDGSGGGAVPPPAPPAGGAGARPGAISLSAARVGCDEGGRGSAEGFAMLMSPSSSPHILILILSPMLFLPYPF